MTGKLKMTQGISGSIRYPKSGKLRKTEPELRTGYIGIKEERSHSEVSTIG